MLPYKIVAIKNCDIDAIIAVHVERTSHGTYVTPRPRVHTATVMVWVGVDDNDERIKIRGNTIPHAEI